MATKSTDPLVLLNAVVYTGTAGSTATTNIGYLDADAEVEVTATLGTGTGPLDAQGIQSGRLRTKQHKKGLSVSVPALQADLDFIALISGETKSGTTVPVGGSSSAYFAPQFSFAVEGTDAAGTTVRLDVPYCSVDQSNSIKLTEATGAQTIVFLAEENTGGDNWTWTKDESVTLATGVLAVTLGTHFVKGEGNTTDALTSITGGTIGDYLMIRPYTTDYVITVTDSENLDLCGDTNFAMGGHIKDHMLLKMTDTTEWTEVRRQDWQ